MILSVFSNFMTMILRPHIPWWCQGEIPFFYSPVHSMDVLATCQSAAKALLFTVHRHNFQFSSKRDGFRIYQQVAQPYNRKAEEQLEPAQVALWLFIITILSFAFCVNWHRQDTRTTTNPQIKCHNKFTPIPWPTGGVLKQHLGRAMQVGMQTLQSSVHVRASPSLLCCRGLHRHHLPLALVCSSRAGSSSMFDTVPLSQAYVI